MIKQAIELKKQIAELKSHNESYPLYKKLAKIFDNFFKKSKTLKAFEGIRIPNHYDDMPKLEKDKGVYENYSRWFMQSTPTQALHGIIELLAEFPDAKSFIDVGSGTGFVVSLAKELGLEAKGIEASKVLIDFVPALSHLEVYNQDFFEFKEFNNFDLIYMWNSIPYKMVQLGQHITDQITDKVAIKGLNEGVLGTPKGAVKEGMSLDSTWNTEKYVITKGI